MFVGDGWTEVKMFQGRRPHVLKSRSPRAKTHGLCVKEIFNFRDSDIIFAFLSHQAKGAILRL